MLIGMRSEQGPEGPGRAARLCPGACALVLCALLSLLCARQALAGGELVFGMSAALTGPARGLGIEYSRGLQAAFDHVNAQGGAKGWKLKLSLRDDGYDPAPAMANTIAFVETERVFALLGYVGTPTTARVLPLIKRYEDTGIALLFPLTGADLLRDPLHASRVYNLRASYVSETRHLVDALVASGRRRVAVFHQADVYGRNGWDGVRQTLRAHGLEIVAEATYRRGAAFSQDFRSEAAHLQAAAPDAIVTVGTAPACAAFIRDARRSGLRALIATLSFADADNLLRLLGEQARTDGRDYAQGLVFSQVAPSYEDTSLAAVRSYRQAMDRLGAALPPRANGGYEPNRYSFVSLEGFLAGLVLAEAVARMGDSPTRDRLRDVFAGMNGLDIGICEPVNFGPGDNQGLEHTFLMVRRGGRFERVETLEAAR